jgi:hypothetical protein
MDSSSSAKKQKTQDNNDFLLCPCCNNMKRLSHTICRSGVAVALCAYRNLGIQFTNVQIGLRDGDSSFRVCSSCSSSSRKAVEVARGQFPNNHLFDKLLKRSMKPRTLHAVFQVVDDDAQYQIYDMVIILIICFDNMTYNLFKIMFRLIYSKLFQTRKEFGMKST